MDLTKRVPVQTLAVCISHTLEKSYESKYFPSSYELLGPLILIWQVVKENEYSIF